MKNKAVVTRNAGPWTFSGCLLAVMFIMLSWGLIPSDAADAFGGEAPAGRKDAAASKKAAVSPAGVRFPALVDVGSKQCIPCKMMEPVLEELKTEYAGVLRVEYIDVRVDPKTAVQLGVRGIPTQIFYDASGKERRRHIGYISKEGILKIFKKLGIELVKKDTRKKTK